MRSKVGFPCSSSGRIFPPPNRPILSTHNTMSHTSHRPSTQRITSSHAIFPLSYPLISTKDLFDTLHEPDAPLSMEGAPTSPTNASPVPVAILQNLTSLRVQAINARDTGNWPQCMQLLQRYVDLKLCIYELFQPEAIVALTNLALLQLSYASFLAMRDQLTASFQILIQVQQTVKMVKDTRLRMALKALVFNNYVNFYYKKRKFNAALKYAREAWSCWRKVSCVKHSLYFLFKLACVELLVNRYKSAMAHFDMIVILEADERVKRIAESVYTAPDEEQEQSHEEENGAQEEPQIEDEPPFDVFFRCNATGNIEMEVLIGSLSRYNMAVCEVALRKYPQALSHSQKAVEDLQMILIPPPEEGDDEEGGEDSTEEASSQQKPLHPWLRHMLRAHQYLTQIANGSHMTYEQFKMKSSDMVNQGFTKKRTTKQRDDLTDEEKRIMEKLSANHMAQQGGAVSPSGKSNLDPETKKEQKLFYVFPHLKPYFSEAPTSDHPYHQQSHHVAEWMDASREERAAARKSNKSRTRTPQWTAGSPSSIDRSHIEEENTEDVRATPSTQLPQMSPKSASMRSPKSRSASPAPLIGKTNDDESTEKPRKKRKIISRGEPSFMKRIHQKQQALEEQKQSTKVQKKKKIVRGAPSLYERHKSQLAVKNRDETFQQEEEERKRKAKLKELRAKSPSSTHRSGAGTTRSDASVEFKSLSKSPQPRAKVPQAMEKSQKTPVQPKDAQKEPVLAKSSNKDSGTTSSTEPNTAPQVQQHSITLPTVRPDTTAPSSSQQSTPTKETPTQLLPKVNPEKETPPAQIAEENPPTETSDFDINALNDEIDAMEADYEAEDTPQADASKQSSSQQEKDAETLNAPRDSNTSDVPLHYAPQKESSHAATESSTQEDSSQAITQQPAQEEFEADFEDDFEQDSPPVHEEQHSAPLAQDDTKQSPQLVEQVAPAQKSALASEKAHSETDAMDMDEMEFGNDFEDMPPAEPEPPGAPAESQGTAQREDHLPAPQDDAMDYAPDFEEVQDVQIEEKATLSTQQAQQPIQEQVSPPLTPETKPPTLSVNQPQSSRDEEQVEESFDDTFDESGFEEEQHHDEYDKETELPQRQVDDQKPIESNDASDQNLDQEMHEEFEMPEDNLEETQENPVSNEEQKPSPRDTQSTTVEQSKPERSPTPPPQDASSAPPESIQNGKAEDIVSADFDDQFEETEFEPQGVDTLQESVPAAVQKQTAQPEAQNTSAQNTPRRRTSKVASIKSNADIASANDFDAEEFSLGGDFEDFEFDEEQRSQKSQQDQSTAPKVEAKVPKLVQQNSIGSFGIDAESLDGMLDDFDDFDTATAPGAGNAGDMDLQFDSRLSARRASSSHKPKSGVVFSPRPESARETTAAAVAPTGPPTDAPVQESKAQPQESFEDDFDFGEMAEDLDLNLGDDDLLDDFEDM